MTMPAFYFTNIKTAYLELEEIKCMSSINFSEKPKVGQSREYLNFVFVLKIRFINSPFWSV